MHSVREWSKEVDLPQNRAVLALHGASSPANTPGIPEVRKSLIDPEVNKKCTKTVLRNTARKTIAQYPADSIKVYTDGSTRENLGQKTSGYGVVVRFPGSIENDEILGSCSGKSNYVAEMVAIQKAVEYIEDDLTRKQHNPVLLCYLQTLCRAYKPLKAQSIRSRNHWQKHWRAWDASKKNTKFGRHSNTYLDMRGSKVTRRLTY
nr:colorectal mutant cancer protein-like [Biomphalaria glabrata]